MDKQFFKNSYTNLGFYDPATVSGSTSVNPLLTYQTSSILIPNLVTDPTVQSSIIAGQLSNTLNQIVGNAINLYDGSTGGTTPVTGPTASLTFTRTDDHTQYYTLQKRSSVNNDTDNVMELFSTPPPTSRYNYLFLGRSGSVYSPNSNIGFIGLVSNTKTAETSSVANGVIGAGIYFNNVPGGGGIQINDSRYQTGGTAISQTSSILFAGGKNDGFPGGFSGIGYQLIANITNISITSNVVTITCANDFSSHISLFGVCQVVIYGATTSTYLNGQILTIVSANATQFTANFTHADDPSHTDTGIATATTVAIGWYMDKLNNVKMGLPIIPDTDNAYDIGDGTHQIKDLYVAGTIHGGSSSCLSIIPKPVMLEQYNLSVSHGDPVSGVAVIGAFVLPFSITINEINLFSNGANSATINLAVYSENGQNKLISVNSFSYVKFSTGPIQVPVSSVRLLPGIYYLAVSGVSGAPSILTYKTFSGSVGLDTLLNNDGGAANHRIYEGTLSITGGTLPTTFNPISDITPTVNSSWIMRLDN